MIRRTQDACWSRGWGAAVLLAVLVAGCATPSIDPTLPLIAPGRVLELPQPGDLGRSVEAAQLVTVHRDGESFAFEGHVSVTPERFQLVGVDGMGRRALTVTWDKSGAVHAQKADWLPDVVAPGPMLADLVVLYWPEPVVRDALTGAGAELLVRDGSRSVVIDGVETFRADYGAGAPPSWSGRLHYRNRAWGYEIDVQSVELAP